jgi:hypothetical protein
MRNEKRITERKHRHKTRADLERETREIFPGDRPKVNFTAIMRQLIKK